MARVEGDRVDDEDAVDVEADLGERGGDAGAQVDRVLRGLRDEGQDGGAVDLDEACLLYTSPSPRD